MIMPRVRVTMKLVKWVRNHPGYLNNYSIIEEVIFSSVMNQKLSNNKGEFAQ